MLNGNVLVKKINEEKTPGGIIVPSGQAKDAELGVVVNCAEAYNSGSNIIVPSEVKIGDRVVYDRYGAQDYKQEGEDMVVLPESRILAVVG